MCRNVNVGISSFPIENDSTHIPLASSQLIKVLAHSKGQLLCRFRKVRHTLMMGADPSGVLSPPTPAPVSPRRDTLNGEIQFRLLPN